MKSDIRERLAFFFGMLIASGLIFIFGLVLEIFRLGNYLLVSVLVFGITVAYVIGASRRMLKVKYIEVKK